MLNDTAKNEAAAINPAMFKAKKAKSAKSAKPAKADKAPKSAKPADTAKPSQDELNATAISAANVAIGRELAQSLETIENARRLAHDHAKALKAALFGTMGPVKHTAIRNDRGHFLPHVAAFLAEVFRDDKRTGAALKMARGRLVQVIATTTEERLGSHTAHEAEKRKRAAQHKGGEGQERVDEEGTLHTDNSSDNSEPSKSAERRQAIADAVGIISERLQNVTRIAGEMPKPTRDKVNAELAQIRAMLKQISGANK